MLDAQSDIKIQGEVLHQDPFQVDVVKELIKSESRETKRRHCIDVDDDTECISSRSVRRYCGQYRLHVNHNFLGGFH